MGQLLPRRTEFDCMCKLCAMRGVFSQLDVPVALKVRLHQLRNSDEQILFIRDCLQSLRTEKDAPVCVRPVWFLLCLVCLLLVSSGGGKRKQLHCHPRDGSGHLLRSPYLSYVALWMRAGYKPTPISSRSSFLGLERGYGDLGNLPTVNVVGARAPVRRTLVWRFLTDLGLEEHRVARGGFVERQCRSLCTRSLFIVFVPPLQPFVLPFSFSGHQAGRKMGTLQHLWLKKQRGGGARPFLVTCSCLAVRLRTSCVP